MLRNFSSFYNRSIFLMILASDMNLDDDDVQEREKANSQTSQSIGSELDDQR